MGREQDAVEMAIAREKAMMQAQQQAPQQMPQRGIPISGGDIVNFVATGVLTPKQAFLLVFRSQPPTEFEGPDSEEVKRKVEKEWADRISTRMQQEQAAADASANEPVKA